mgnify:CR=1 FL=1
MKEFCFVGFGGFIGSTLRYRINIFSNKLIYVQIIPYGSLIANCLGCLLVGLSLGLSNKFNLEPESINLFNVFFVY